jgi:hypothetical protein
MRQELYYYNLRSSVQTPLHLLIMEENLWN